MDVVGYITGKSAISKTMGLMITVIFNKPKGLTMAALGVANDRQAPRFAGGYNLRDPTPR